MGLICIFRSKRTGKSPGNEVSLFTDLYELTMASTYFENSMDGTVTFEFYVRDLPKDRGYLLVAGLEQSLNYLKDLNFSGDAIRYLRSTGLFKETFLRYLSRLRFTGDVYAIPEGELAFEGEPLFSITAPRIQAQIIETYLMNNTGFQTMIATKASRIMHAARGRGVVDFSPRRDHGVDSALKVARASYIAGMSATSNVLAGKVFGIPVSGTIAHSYVMSFEKEEKAFDTFVRTYPDNSVLLIDTYDTVQGARIAAEVGRKMKAKGKQLKGVRLDSGDLAALSKKVRKILDSAGLRKTKIFASGNLDEYKIAALLRKGAKIDSFGVGTELGTSGDAPSLNCAYKLVEDSDADGNPRPVMKLSRDKETMPGAKQVFRTVSKSRFLKDTIGARTENIPGKRLLRKVMAKGEPLCGHPSLAAIRKRAENNLSRLPERFKKITRPSRYNVKASSSLLKAAENFRKRHRVKQ